MGAVANAAILESSRKKALTQITNDRAVTQAGALSHGPAAVSLLYSPADAGVTMAPASVVAARDKRIKVCVRIRPFTKNEAVKAGGKAAWTWCVLTAKSYVLCLLNGAAGVLTDGIVYYMWAALLNK